MIHARRTTRPVGIAHVSAALLIAATGLSQFPFDAPRTFDSGFIQAWGDVDGDGDVDLIRFPNDPVAAGTVSTELNAGAWRFVTVAAGAKAAGVGRFAAVADVTGDGLGDLVMSVDQGVRCPSAGLEVWRSRGDGTFEPPRFTDLAGAVIDLLIGDADGDATMEICVQIAVPIGSPRLTWFDVSPGATISSIPGMWIPLASNATAIVDADGDGDDDVAAIVWPAGGITFMLSEPGAIVPFGFVAMPPPVSGMLVTGDLDGDGDADLAQVRTTGAAGSGAPVQIMRIVNGGGGVWTPFPFAAVTNVTVAIYNQPVAFGLEDVTGDGRADLEFVTTYGSTYTIQVAAGGATGTFTRVFAGVYFDGHPDTLGVTPQRAPPGDLNGDGKQDLVFPRMIFSGSLAESGVGPYLGVVSHARLRDVEGDGDLDVVGTFGIGMNLGDGLMTSVAVTLPPPPAGHYFGAVRAIADVDDDHIPDWIIDEALGPYETSPIVAQRRYRLDGNTALVDLGPIAPPGVVFYRKASSSPEADFDGDGDLDLAATGAVAINDGAGHFTPVPTSEPGLDPVDTGDVDGDGDADILCSYVGYDGIYLLRNLSGAQFRTETLLDRFTTPDVATPPRLRDLDGDGDLDVVYGLAPGNMTTEAHVLENVAGRFRDVLAPLPVVQSGLGERVVEAADFDGDGLIDLCIGDVSRQNPIPIHNARVWFCRRLAPGWVFDAPMAFLTTGLSEIADVDSDGDPDIVGWLLLRNRRGEDLDRGVVRQYGDGTPGSESFRPRLGYAGTMQAASHGALRIRFGLGGADGLLVAGAHESNVANSPLPGLVSYAEPWLVLAPLTLGGTPGAAGNGWLDVPMVPPAAIAGLDLFIQIGVLDAGATPGAAVSQGLQLRFAP